MPTIERRYIVALGRYIARDEIVNGIASRVFYHGDHLGSTRVLSGSDSGSLTYDPFGNLVEITDDVENHNHRFTGKPIDSTGLYYFGARFYDPAIGRFITMDPAKDGRNWYIYCNNNPLVYVDPDGRDPVTAVLILGFMFAPEVSELVSVYGPAIAQGVNELILFCGDKIPALLDGAKELGRSIVDFFKREAGSKGGGTGDPDPDRKRTSKTVPQVADSQVGKKLVEHAADYGLTKSKEGAVAYKQITQDVLENAQTVKTGNWRTLGECEFWIKANNVAIVKDGNWVSTFPLNKPGTVEYINSLPIKK